eukprot:TRINITY_DN333_c3_g1_i1.p1 TRINITY_DN333_c3_g1~~TRINITY_DN333_c3_g1_i1.p1  ORF type:complete len:237 (+),score=75.32 TRINITY_DN333_c3_g1_i1:134-844(+)
MADEMRRMLDELMGKERNVSFEERGRKRVHFSDPDICKHYIVQFCPHELFTNTKSDLGSCGKQHDELAKRQWDECSRKRDYPFEREFVAYLERLVDELDRRVKRGRDRLGRQDELAPPPLAPEVEQRINAISERIQQLLKQIEDLGEEGKVDESQQLMNVVDQLKIDRDTQLRKASGELSSYAQQEKRMKVCDICGAFLVVGDAEKRVQSHMDGKQHIGYQVVKSSVLSVSLFWHI